MKALIIYGKTSCPWCDKVESYCKEFNIPYKKLMLNQDYERSELLKIVDSHKGTVYPLTVPKVVSEDNTLYYDTSDEFEKYFKRDLSIGDQNG
jgi:glutaredoxin